MGPNPAIILPASVVVDVVFSHAEEERAVHMRADGRADERTTYNAVFRKRDIAFADSIPFQPFSSQSANSAKSALFLSFLGWTIFGLCFVCDTLAGTGEDQEEDALCPSYHPKIAAGIGVPRIQKPAP